MLMNEDTMYHIGLKKSDIEGAKYAILPGDPKRVEVISSYLENSKPLTVSREYTSFLGTIAGEKVLVISTGMGGPSAAICIEELHMIGIENLIRVGTSGGMQTDILPGDLVIATGAIRMEGTTKEYSPIEYPAVADFNLVTALKSACDELGFRYHLGVVQSKDSFYGQHSPERMPVSYELENKWQAWIKSGSLCSEMETAALYIVASVLRMKAASILTVVWNQERVNQGISDPSDFSVDNEIKVTVKAIENLINRNK